MYKSSGPRKVWQYCQNLAKGILRYGTYFQKVYTHCTKSHRINTLSLWLKRVYNSYLYGTVGPMFCDTLYQPGQLLRYCLNHLLCNPGNEHWGDSKYLSMDLDDLHDHVFNVVSYSCQQIKKSHLWLRYRTNFAHLMCKGSFPHIHEKILNFSAISQDISNIIFLLTCWFFAGLPLKASFVDILFYGTYNWIGLFLHIGLKQTII